MAMKIGNFQVFPHNYFFDFMKWRKITVGISALLFLSALLVIMIKGVNYSIDFLGGSEVQVQVSGGLTRDSLADSIQKLGYDHVEVTADESKTIQGQTSQFLIRLQRLKGQDENATSARTDELIQKLKNQIGADKVQVITMTNISGKIGKEEERKGYLALLLACLGILIYIAVRFDARFAPGAVICLIHNVIIALGFMTAIDRPFTTASIAAFLTIVGYTINDTVIVYDRIRETRMLQPKMNLIDVVNKSISQTMNRTVLTSTTGILALLVLSVLGGGSIEDFAITMLVGIVVGTYSSIYVAAPLTLMMDKFLDKIGIKEKVQDATVVKSKAEDYAPPIMLRKKK